MESYTIAIHAAAGIGGFFVARSIVLPPHIAQKNEVPRVWPESAVIGASIGYIFGLSTGIVALSVIGVLTPILLSFLEIGFMYLI